MKMIGKTIHGYKIQKRIGKGGMGSVYLAKHTTLSKVVAIKVVNLDAGGASSDEMALRFKREAKLHAMLGRHPNIIELENYLVEDNHYIFMEYFESVELATVMGKTGVMLHKRALPIFKQILAGIEHTHDIGVIHRDIKPTNILINKKDEVKIADYGIAIEVSEKNKKKKIEDITKIENKSIIGSGLYRSPEMILGEDLSYTSDIYLLGITFYQMLTKKLPFEKKDYDTDELKRAMIFDIPKPPTDHYPDIPEHIVNAVMMALNKKPKDRQQSCKEFLSNLEGKSQASSVPVKKSTPVKRKVSSNKKSPIQPSTNESGLNSVLKWGGGFAILILGMILLTEYDKKPINLSPFSPQKSVNVASHYKKGKKYYNSKKYDMAIEEFRICLDEAPSHIDARLYRAQAYFEKEQYGPAHNDATYLINNYANNDAKKYDIYNLRAEIRYRLQEWELAIEDFSFIIRYDEDSPDRLSRRGWARYHIGFLDDGIKDFNKSIIGYKSKKIKSYKLGDAYYGRGICNFSKSPPEFKKAEKDLEKALDYDKKNARYWYNKARVNYEWSKTEENTRKKKRLVENACDDVREAINLGNKNAEKLLMVLGCG